MTWFYFTFTITLSLAMVVANNGITMTKNKGELLAILIANQMWQDKAHLPMEHIQGFT
jgi:hypothetical protein